MDFGYNAADERREAVRARRAAAEEARKAALLQKVASRESAASDGGQGGPEAQIVRLQQALDAVPAGGAHEATRAGLQKQLATHRATLVREQRKREQAVREAAAARAAQEQEAARRREAAEEEPQAVW
jgi:hypothetical protein|eukprot:5944258-Prymnesium_polylepis.1